jgi:hypothetical protein
MPFDFPSDRHHAVLSWLAAHGAAATSAARLLGGRSAGDSVRLLFGELCSSEQLNRRHLVRLSQLRDLLMLNSDGASCDLPVDPADPADHDICLVAESLDDLVESFGIRGRH